MYAVVKMKTNKQKHAIIDKSRRLQRQCPPIKPATSTHRFHTLPVL